MMKEEFEQIIHDKVSDEFYTYVIEPMYEKSKMSKQAFVSILNRDMIQLRGYQFDDILSGKKQDDEITTESGHNVFDEYQIQDILRKEKEYKNEQ